jgi:ABC-type glycerol-3-phosphate transport system substrate-binding protein
MTRRLAAVLLATGLAAAMAACSAEDGSQDADGAGDDSSGEAAAPGEPRELLIWDTGILGGALLENGEPDLDKSFLDWAAAEFETENPGVEVTTFQQGGDISSNAAQFQAASIAGDGPDIRIQYAGGPTLSFEQFFLDLSDTFTTEFEDMSGWSTVRADYDPEGAVLGMPYGGGLYFVVFANNAVLDEAGLDPDDPPETWEEFLDNARVVEENTDKEGVWVANQEGYVGAWVVGALIGGELGEQASLDMYTGAAPVDSDAMVEVYQAWSDFGASELTNPDAGQLSNGDAVTGFVQGNAAYYLAGTWENQRMVDEFGDGVSWFFIPMLEGAEYPATAAGGPSIAVSITNYSENQDLAQDFLRFIATPEMQDEYVQRTIFSEASNHKEADPSVISNPLLQSQAEALPDIDNVVFPFDSVMPQSVIDLFYRVNASTFLNQVTPEDAASQLQDANQQELANRSE